MDARTKIFANFHLRHGGHSRRVSEASKLLSDTYDKSALVQEYLSEYLSYGAESTGHPIGKTIIVPNEQDLWIETIVL